MASSYRDSLRNTRMNAITTDAGATAVLTVWSGAPAGKSAGVYNADPGTLLASLPMSNPIAAAAVAGLLTLSAITSALGLASGSPQSYRIKTVAGGAPSTVVSEGDAGVGTGSLNFASPISNGGQVSVSSGTMTEGNP